MKLRLASLALTALLATTLASCGKEPNAPSPVSNNAPAVPPASSVNFDFGFFTSKGAAQIAAAHPDGVDASTARSNWINAAVRVMYLNLTVQDLFSAPAQALNAALSTKPVLGQDGWYVWTYAIMDSGRTVTLKLRARVDGTVVSWQMHASDSGANPPLNDFTWFTGETRIGSDTGYWLFNDRKAGATVAVARIDWNAASPTRRQLSFRNVETGSAHFGDQLEYTLDGSDVSVIFHDAVANKDSDISWNEANGRGSLLVPDYNNGERACWDEHQEDMVCPAQ